MRDDAPSITTGARSGTVRTRYRYRSGLSGWVSSSWPSGCTREKGGHQKDAKDYFLASKSLPWWAIGASLIAANISAEQIIGMSGSGYAIGLAIASYEWTAALALLVVGKFFLPVFLRNGIYTMPQFLEQRYGTRIRTLMAVFWLLLYVFVNLTSIMWLGSIAVSQVTGMDQMLALTLLGVFALVYQLYGGLKAVALTDIVQVSLLVLGGLLVAGLTLNQIGDGGGVIAGFQKLWSQHPEHFEMILSKNNPFYKDLPGLSVLLGGMWVMHFSYWGFNQYIIQRALAAKSIGEAQKGMLFAAFIKLLMPVIVVLPGIAAVVLAPGLDKPDQAYPTMMRLLPTGILGLVFAALVAAIVASLASKINSVATIFTLDFYAKSRSKPSEARQVKVGRIAAAVAVLLGILTAKPLLGEFRPGLPVHPGIHRLLHSGHRGDLRARPVLEAHQRGRRAGRRAGFGAAVGGLLLGAEDRRLPAAVHGPGRHRVSGRAGAGGGGVAGHRARRG